MFIGTNTRYREVTDVGGRNGRRNKGFIFAASGILSLGWLALPVELVQSTNSMVKGVKSPLQWICTLPAPILHAVDRVDCWLNIENPSG
jgi:hypothetical protein